MKERISFRLNGREVEVETEPGGMLLELLREHFCLTGAKRGCGQGECGACTVIMDGRAVNACILPVGKVRGADIRTVEGLAPAGQLHPLQEEFISQGAVQCGFCTPGMLLSAKALLAENPDPTPADIRGAIGGNICRCTGYVKIEKAVLSAAARLREEGEQ